MGHRAIKTGASSVAAEGSRVAWVRTSCPRGSRGSTPDSMRCRLGSISLASVPGLGEIADGINGLISLARGDYAGAALSFAAMIPFAGWAATASKWGKQTVNAVDAVGDVTRAATKYGDKAASVLSITSRNTDKAAQFASKNSDELAVGFAKRVKGSPLPGDSVVHRIGGGQAENLALKPREMVDNPPGFSVLEGGTPQAARKQMIEAFPKATNLHKAAETVGTATVQDVRKAGFDVIHDPTKNFPNHASVIHPEGLAGFTPENLEKLSKVFRNTFLGG